MQTIQALAIALIAWLAAEGLEAVAGRTAAMVATAAVFVLCCAILAAPAQPR